MKVPHFSWSPKFQSHMKTSWSPKCKKLFIPKSHENQRPPVLCPHTRRRKEWQGSVGGQPATTDQCGWLLQQLLQDSESHVAKGYFAEVKKKYKHLNYVVSICGHLALICCSGKKVRKKKVWGHLSIRN